MENKLYYRPETAGHIMTREVPVLSESATIKEVKELLERETKNFNTINYIYLTDSLNHLTGVVSIKEIFRQPEQTPLKKLSLPKIVTVRAHTDQERVALLAVEHNIKAVPVIDKNDSFLGVVTSDTILNILHSENIEDVLRYAGAGKMEKPALDIIHAGAWLHFRKRLPWLVLGLAGGLLAAFVVRFFEDALKEKIILAAFIPTIVYMADAVGTQTQIIFIRSLALEHKLNLNKYLKREFRINFLLAGILGLLIAVFALFWLHSAVVSLILGLSILITVVVAMIVAVALPYFLQKMKFDPAIASGPFSTVVRDILSLIIYFLVASLILPG